MTPTVRSGRERLTAPMVPQSKRSPTPPVHRGISNSDTDNHTTEYGQKHRKYCTPRKNGQQRCRSNEPNRQQRRQSHKERTASTTDCHTEVRPASPPVTEEETPTTLPVSRQETPQLKRYNGRQRQAMPTIKRAVQATTPKNEGCSQRQRRSHRTDANDTDSQTEGTHSDAADQTTRMYHDTDDTNGGTAKNTASHKTKDAEDTESQTEIMHNRQDVINSNYGQ